jgi:hypothetical protein
LPKIIDLQQAHISAPLSTREFVSDSAHGMEKPDLAAVVFKIPAEIQNEIVDGACGRIYIVPPYRL